MSRGLFVARLHGTVLENSTACVCDETDVVPISCGLPEERGTTSLPVNLELTIPVRSRTDAFRASRLYGRHQFVSPSGETICFFTESLILAQDERWRRA